MAAAGGPGDARHASGGDAQPARSGLVSAAPGHRQLSQYLARLSCTAEQVLITSGYSGSLRLILDTLASRSDKVVFEDPGYFMGQQLLKRIVPRLHTVPVDRCGMDTDYLLRHHRDARFAIVTPSHQSPLAVTLSCRVNSSCSTGPARTRRGSSKTITTASFTTPARCCRR
jgi:DNA-binding transcriptional MocR family regulator